MATKDSPADGSYNPNDNPGFVSPYDPNVNPQLRADQNPFRLAALQYAINPLLGRQFDNLAYLPQPTGTGQPFWAAQAPAAQWNQMGFQKSGYFPGLQSGQMSPRGTNLGFGTMYGYPMGQQPGAQPNPTIANPIGRPTPFGFGGTVSAPPGNPGGSPPPGSFEGGGTSGPPGGQTIDRGGNPVGGGSTAPGGVGTGLPGDGTAINWGDYFAGRQGTAAPSDFVSTYQGLLYSPSSAAVNYTPEQRQALANAGVPLQLDDTSQLYWNGKLYDRMNLDTLRRQMTPTQLANVRNQMISLGVASPNELAWGGSSNLGFGG